jgi:hypothetical protein
MQASASVLANSTMMLRGLALAEALPPSQTEDDHASATATQAADGPINRAFEMRVNGPVYKTGDQSVPRSDQPYLPHILFLPPQYANKTHAKADPVPHPVRHCQNAIALIPRWNSDSNLARLARTAWPPPQPLSARCTGPR